MKIALVGLRLSIGMRLIVDSLGAALAQQGHSVVFVGARHRLPGPVRAVATHGGSSYPAMLRQALSPRFHRDVVLALAREKPDICFFFSVHPANGLLCREVRRHVRAGSGRPPVVAVQIHDPVPHPGPAWPLIFGAQLLMARAADRVVVFGQTLADQIVRLYRVRRDRIIVVAHGASRPPRSHAPAEIPSRHFSFLGRIDGYKGLEIFLAAAKRFAGEWPEARFRVGGAGSLRPYRRALEALGDAVMVENRELTNDATDRIMQASWAVVLPYTSGTQSGVIPVAYWNACPVITTRVGSFPELVREGETGFLVEPRDPDAVFQSMRRLWNNPALRQSMGRQAFALYDQALRWEAIGEQLVAALTTRESVGAGSEDVG